MRKLNFKVVRAGERWPEYLSHYHQNHWRSRSKASQALMELQMIIVDSLRQNAKSMHLCAFNGEEGFMGLLWYLLGLCLLVTFRGVTMANPGDWSLYLGRQLASRVNTIGRRFMSVIRHLESAHPSTADFLFPDLLGLFIGPILVKSVQLAGSGPFPMMFQQRT